MKRVSVCVSFLLLFFVTEDTPVEGATCTVVPTCEATDYTLSSCNPVSKTCDCKPGYVAIRSGCGEKLKTPHISAPPENSFQVKANSSFNLICVSASEGVKFDFFKNGDPTTDLQNASGNLSEVGNYSCRASISELQSDNSAVVKFEVISSNFSNVKPKISVPVAKVFNMSMVELKCLDVPIGYVGKVKVNGTIIEPPNVQVSYDNEQLPVRCVIVNPPAIEIESPEGKLPELTTTIDDVTVVVEGYPEMETIVIKEAKATGNPRLMCETSPPLDYLDKDTTFQWKRDGTDIGAPESSNIYPLTEHDNATANYTCSVNYPGAAKATASRNVIKLIINDGYLKKPNISISASKPLLGGRLKISCDVANNMPGVRYGWKLESKDITGQLDRILQLDNLTARDNGDYTCSLTKDNFVVTSDPVHVSAVSNISKPLVTMVGTNPSNTELALGGSYTLTCTTESYTVGMNYTWRVNGTAKAGTQTFNIGSVKYTDAGNYTCKVAFQGLSGESDIFEVKIIAPGVKCTTDADCSKMGTGYTGKCDTTAKRCTCSSHYKMNGEKCENAALSMMSSTLVLVCAYVLSQLFSY